MKVSVRLFGPYAIAAQNNAVDVDLPENIDLTAGLLKAALVTQHPSLGSLLGPAVVAVNHQAVRSEHRVRHGDELAIIGLVGGG